MKNKTVGVVLLAALCIGTLSFLAYKLKSAITEGYAQQAASTPPSHMLSRQIAAQRLLQKKAREDQQHKNSAVRNLTDEQIRQINEFVGVSQETDRIPLPSGGEKVKFNGKYRHAVLLKRGEDGTVRKVEIGPDGIQHNE